MRKPIDTEVRGLMTPRERIWNAILSLPKNAQFTKTTLQDHCHPMVSWTAVDDYLPALEKAGYIKRTGGQSVAPGRLGLPITYTLLKRAPEAPRLSKLGEPVTQGTANLAMWRAMKVLKSFDYVDICNAATMPPLVVKPQTAKSYVLLLARAGYLQEVRASKPGTPARYRLLRNTGAHAPAITRRKCVFDRNTGTFAELETAQEVCDGCDE